MSAPFTSYAILGAGGVGGVVTDELLKKNLKVTILTRDDTKADLQDFKSRGAVLAKVDYDDRESLKKALTGVEAVVSAVSPYAMDIQVEVVHAAKEAGVQLFVPAEYGVYITEGPNSSKKVVQDLLKRLDLPYTVFYTGLFYEFAPYTLGHNWTEGKVTIVGDGKTKLSLTKRDDVGKFVAHVVSTASKDDLKWAKIPFEGDRKTPLEIVEIAEKKLGKKIDITFVDYEENKKNYLTDFNSFLNTLFADGDGVPGTEEEVAAAKAKYFPEWNPTPYEAIIN